MKKTAFILLIFAIGCTSFSKKEWTQLENRGFQFSSFQYERRTAKKEEAHLIMKNFPVQDLLSSLSKKYSIHINSTEYKSFIFDKKLEKIKVEGLIIDQFFTWRTNEKKPNRIEMHYNIVSPERLEGYVYVIKIHMFVSNTMVEGFETEADTPKKALKYLQKKLNKQPDITTAQDLNKYKDNKDNSISREQEKKLKKAMEEYMKNLTPEERKKFKKRMMKK